MSGSGPPTESLAAISVSTGSSAAASYLPALNRPLFTYTAEFEDETQIELVGRSGTCRLVLHPCIKAGGAADGASGAADGASEDGVEGPASAGKGERHCLVFSNFPGDEPMSLAAKAIAANFVGIKYSGSEAIPAENMHVCDTYKALEIVHKKITGSELCIVVVSHGAILTRDGKRLLCLVTEENGNMTAAVAFEPLLEIASREFARATVLLSTCNSGFVGENDPIPPPQLCVFSCEVKKRAVSDNFVPNWVKKFVRPKDGGMYEIPEISHITIEAVLLGLDVLKEHEARKEDKHKTSQSIMDIGGIFSTHSQKIPKDLKALWFVVVALRFQAAQPSAPPLGCTDDTAKMKSDDGQTCNCSIQ
jgi:hypothetical protein